MQVVPLVQFLLVCRYPRPSQVIPLLPQVRVSQHSLASQVGPAQVVEFRKLLRIFSFGQSLAANATEFSPPAFVLSQRPQQYSDVQGGAEAGAPDLRFFSERTLKWMGAKGNRKLGTKN